MRYWTKDRSSWPPSEDKRIGSGYFEDGTRGDVYLLGDGSFQLVSKDITRFLTVPSKRVFDNKTDEFFFCLFNRRKWYLFRNGTFYEAKYSQKYRKRR